MPTINDTTVVASAYTTSSSARPQRLSNGWIVTAEMDSTKVYFQVSKDNGQTFQSFGYWTTSGTQSFSMVAKGTLIYLLVTQNTNSIYYATFDVLLQTGSTLIGNTNTSVDVSQTAFSGCSLAIDSTGTYLHACWSSKNATYPNSFNIRYAKGTIASDGSVTWGTVVQITANNMAGTDDKNPVIFTKSDNTPTIICESKQANYYIASYSFNGSIWGYHSIYSIATYSQSSPSAIFVPQSVNGLASGRIHCSWYGYDATDTTKFNIRYSYSDDLGVTWSAMAKLTSGNVYSQLDPSITTNKNNEICVVYCGNDVASPTYTNIMKIKNISGTWGGITKITTNTTSQATFPSTLYDPTFNYTEPLFIYQNLQTTKVGFYGTWTVTTISVTQGSIGTKADKTNLLSYNIVTNGTMSTITESVNGVSVGTKTATSGQSLITGLTQAQWDNVKYGKYTAPFPIGTNLLPDINSWTLDAGTTRISANSFRTSSSEKYVGIRIALNNLVIGCTYIVNFNLAITTGTGWVRVYDGITNNGAVLLSTNTSNVTNSYSFTSISNSVYINLTNFNTASIPSDMIFSNISMLQATVNNTLMVKMGTDTFTYTFDKRLATTDDITSAMKAVADTQSTFLPSVKAKLGSAIRAKGGSVNDTDSFDVIQNAIMSDIKKKWAKGTATSVVNKLTVSGLAFIPTHVRWYLDGNNYGASQKGDVNVTNCISNVGQAQTPNTYDSSGFTIYIQVNASVQWVAYE